MNIGSSPLKSIFDNRVYILYNRSIFLTHILRIYSVSDFNTFSLYPLKKIIKFCLLCISVGLINYLQHITTIGKFWMYALAYQMREIVQSITIQRVGENHFDFRPIFSNRNHLVLSSPLWINQLESFFGKA